MSSHTEAIPNSNYSGLYEFFFLGSSVVSMSRLKEIQNLFVAGAALTLQVYNGGNPPFYVNIFVISTGVFPAKGYLDPNNHAGVFHRLSSSYTIGFTDVFPTFRVVEPNNSFNHADNSLNKPKYYSIDELSTFLEREQNVSNSS